MKFTPEQIEQLKARTEAAAAAFAAPPGAAGAGDKKKGVTDRRSQARVAMKRAIEVTLKKEGEAPATIEAWFQDLSVDGLGLVTPGPLSIGHRIAVALGMPRQMMDYIVKRCQPLSEGMYSVGCMKAPLGRAKARAKEEEGEDEVEGGNAKANAGKVSPKGPMKGGVSANGKGKMNAHAKARPRA